MKKITSIALLLCTLLITACGGNTTTAETVDTTAETAADENKITPDIPDDLRYEGRSFRLLATPDAYYGTADVESFELDKADVLQQALYYRILSVEERFGITTEWNYGVERQIANMSRQSVNAMSDDYDLVADVADWHKGVVYEGIYMPVNDLPYVDLDKPWWNKNYIQSVSVNPDNPYILFGAINHNGLQRSICTFFNIDLLRDRTGIDEQDMYDIVNDGEWTLDKMAEIIKGIYTDENGNTKPDEEDKYGFVHWDEWQVNFMAFSSGLTFIGRDEDGYPMLALNNERSVDLVDKLLTLFVGNEDTYDHKDNHGHTDFFGTGHAAFMVNRFFVAEWPELRDSATLNYGIIPAPKYDETVDNYYTAVANNAQWQMVPITEPDPEFASAIIEYLGWYGYEKVLPAYYDINLKFKYVRGDVDGASRMLDLIVENQFSDFLSVNELNGMENIFLNTIRSGSNTFASKYASYEMGANNKIKKLIEALG